MQITTMPTPLSPEVIDDRVAMVLEAGTNITLTYDDAANVLTIDATPGGSGYTDEQAQDAVGNILQDSATIDYVYNDTTPYITGLVKDNSITEAMLSLSDNTSKDATVSVHGLLPKLSGNTVTFLRGDGTWVEPPTGTSYTDEQAQDAVGAMLITTSTISFTYSDAANTLAADVRDASITEVKMSLSDTTTQNVTTTRHGLVPKAPNNATQYLDGTGTWSTPAGGGGSYTNEEAQDAVGTILTDTATIDFTYNDATPSITADVKNVSITPAKMSMSFSGNILGRGSAGSGSAEELGVASPLGISGGYLRFTAPGTTGQVMFNNGATIDAGTAIQFNGAGSIITALYPMTQKGEIFTRTASGFAAHPVGTNGQVLTADSTHENGMRWTTPATGASTFLALTDTPDTYASNALKILRANAAATATEFGPVLGTMAEQNANAVAITGGSISGTGVSINGVGSVSAYGNFSRGNSTGDFQNGFYTDLAAAGGTNRYAVNCAGTAPSYFGGTVQVAGNLGIGKAPTSHRLDILYDRANNAAITIQPNADSGPGGAIWFTNAAYSIVGSITTTNSSTAYNTSSDVRLKHSIQNITNALARIRALRPVSFFWNADDSPGEGFLAHELQQQIPLAVTGEPDALNDDGSIRPQQVDHSKIVPWLTAALKEAYEQIQALTARVEALEGALA